MDHNISRSEKKRQAKNIEKITRELLDLSASHIQKLPCDDFIKKEIKDAKNLKTGALKRQLKYITKQLRDIDIEPILSYLEEQKGSKLKIDKSFHELERIRDSIATEAIEAYREASHLNIPFDSTSWSSETIRLAAERFSAIDHGTIKLAAIKYAKSRKPCFNREIFRILKAALQQQEIQIITTVNQE